MSDYVSKAKRREVFARARGCCEYCRSQDYYSTQAFSIEHIIPGSKGGSGELGNLALACQGATTTNPTRSRALIRKAAGWSRFFIPGSSGGASILRGAPTSR